MNCDPDVACQLDFDSVLTILSQFCLSADGKGFIANRTFLDDEQQIEEELALVQEARELLGSLKSFSAEDFPSVSKTMEALTDQRIELRTIQLYQLARYVSSIIRLRAKILEDKKEGQLRKLFEDMPVLIQLRDYIFDVIDAEGELIIENIDVLDTLQQQQMDAAREIKKELTRVYRRNTNYYQSSVPTIRSNRFCLALNADFLGKIPSVVIDQSESGNTLFIEPLPCVQINNRWLRYCHRFEKERRAFVTKLIERIRGEYNELEKMKTQFAFLDSVLARAQFSKQFHCSAAKFTDKNISLHKVRHPLLGDKAVPIDIHPAVDCRVTVISGPNGGGKTVTLKSVGLMILMHYFAMHIPAETGSLIPRCEYVLLLMGDQQSILSHQSSFTAQMKKLASMTEVMNQRSVVLFDELGGNTDPEEGVALSKAILAYCCERQACTFLTTHFTQLKEQAIQHEDMELISMEYDHKRNQPRFVVVNGLLEGSHALQVAELVGLDVAIVKSARQILKGDAASYKQLLADMLKERQEQQTQREKLQKLQARLAEQEREIVERENRVRAKYIADIENVISSGRKRLEQLVAQVRAKNIALPTKEIHAELNATSGQLSKHAQQLQDQITPPRDTQKSHVRINDRVHVDGRAQPFVITRLFDDHTAEISNGTVRMRVAMSRVTIIAQDAQQTEGNRTIPILHDAPSKPFVSVLDIRGKRTDEVEPLILKQINDALYNNRQSFSIVHGIGSGALQKEVARILDRNSAIASRRYADIGDGGEGKTLVTLQSEDKK